jgi:hypothetical protein
LDRVRLSIAIRDWLKGSTPGLALLPIEALLRVKAKNGSQWPV